jgi:hypothetical protein
MVVQGAPFVPFFILGLGFLFGPGLAVTFFFNSTPPGAAVVVLTGLAALIRPQASWTLVMVLCALRTVPFIMAAVMAIELRFGLAPRGLLFLALYIAVGALAQWRLRALRRSGEVEI